jgi:hypothetical protein
MRGPFSLLMGYFSKGGCGNLHETASTDGAHTALEVFYRQTMDNIKSISSFIFFIRYPFWIIRDHSASMNNQSHCAVYSPQKAATRHKLPLAKRETFVGCSRGTTSLCKVNMNQVNQLPCIEVPISKIVQSHISHLPRDRDNTDLGSGQKPTSMASFLFDIRRRLGWTRKLRPFRISIRCERRWRIVKNSWGVSSFETVRTSRPPTNDR